MFDMLKMMGKIKEAQAKIQEVTENLHRIVVEGESGGGMVKATANGKREVLKIEIDPILIKPEDQNLMQDLVVAAVNKALQKAEEEAKEELRKKTDGLLPNIPGMDLGAFGAK